MQSDDIVCNCMQLTVEELENAIKQSALTLVALQEATGAATGCGRCAPQVIRILNEREA